MSPQGQQSTAKGGTFTGTAAVSLFARLVQDQYTGAVEIESSDGTKTIWFQSGKPIGVTSTMPDERLLRLASHWNMITKPQYLQLLTEMKRSQKRSGELLIEKGLLPKDKLEAALVRQIRYRAAALLAMHTGSYTFTDRELDGSLTDINVLQTMVDSIAMRYPGAKWARRKEELSERLFSIDKSTYSRLSWLIGNHGPSKQLLQFFVKGNRKASCWQQQGQSESAIDSLWKLTHTMIDLGVLVEQKVGRRSEEIAKEEKSVDDQLESMLASLKDKNAFEIMNLEKTATDSDVKKAYFVLAKKYHPDKFYNRSTDTNSESAEKLFSHIQRAYDAIRVEADRKEYLQFLETGNTKEEAVEEAQKILQSELEFQKAQILVKRRKYEEAFTHFEEALELNPGEKEFQGYFAWAKFLHAWPDEPEDAQTQLALLARVSKEIKNAELTYLSGRGYNIVGDLQHAKNQFEAALGFNPKHSDAKRDLGIVKSKLNK